MTQIPPKAALFMHEKKDAINDTWCEGEKRKSSEIISD